jgi:hypothetical protein
VTAHNAAYAWALGVLVTAGILGDHRLLLGAAAVAAVATVLDVRAAHRARKDGQS